MGGDEKWDHINAIKKSAWGLGKMASWVKCLLFKHEELSLDFQNPFKSQMR